MNHLLWVVGLITLIFGGYKTYDYMYTPATAGKSSLYLAIAAFAISLICWAIFFFLWKPARIHLRKPGPYLALFIFLLCTLPVLIWNSQNL